MARELFDTLEFVASQILHEGAEGKSKRMKVRGKFQSADPKKKNRNGRVYTESLWNKTLNPEGSFKKRLKEGRVLGHLEHPKEGGTSLKEVSHKIESVELQGLDVIGEAVIFNTPAGMILQELFDAGVPVGISSRGRGETKTTPDGIEEVDENTYELDTFDFVAEPSVGDALPIPVMESTDKLSGQEKEMDEKNSRALGSTGVGISLIEKEITESASASGITESLKKINEMATTLEGIPGVESQSLQGRLDALQNLAMDKMAKFTAESDEKKARESVELDKLRKENKALLEQKKRAVKIIEDLRDIVLESKKDPKKKNESRMLKKAMDLIEGLRQKYWMLEKQHNAAKKLIESLSKKTKKEDKKDESANRDPLPNDKDPKDKKLVEGAEKDKSNESKAQAPRILKDLCGAKA